MAVIQYTAIVNQIRGKLNGSVFNKAKTVNTLQRKQQQPKGNRGFQSEIRSIFARFQRDWKALSNVNKQSWATCASNNPTRDRFGNLVSLSGYNQFIKASIMNEYGGGAPLTAAYSSPAPSNSIVTDVFQGGGFTATNDGVVFEQQFLFALDVYGPEWIVLIEISVPVSAGVTNYHGRWVSVYGQVVLAEGFEEVEQNLGFKYPMPQAGNRIYYRSRLLHRTSGAVVNVQEGSFVYAP